MRIKMLPRFERIELCPFFLLLLQVGFLNSGKVVALDVSFYSNAGNSFDLSLPVSIITHNRDSLAHSCEYALILSPVCF